jgi:hypothetical protein
MFAFVSSILGICLLIGARPAGGEPSQRFLSSIFLPSSTGGAWIEQAHNMAPDGAASDDFGYSVAISDDTAIVGAPSRDTGRGVNTGSAYVFTRSAGVWTLQQILTASDGEQYDWFGFSVAISGDTAIVGAVFDDTAAGTNAGSAYVFTRSSGVWTEQQKLTASDGWTWAGFGRSVAIGKDTVIVGAPFYHVDAPEEGAAYVFTRTNSVWTQHQRLITADSSAEDFFGYSVAISDETAIVSALLGAGSAYVFTQTGGIWTQQQKLTPDEDYSQFGGSVAISGENVIVGAAYATTTADFQAGAAYIFSRSEDVWARQQKLYASDGAIVNNFGFSVAIDDDMALVGSPHGLTAAGSAYVFKRGKGDWTQYQKLTASDGVVGDAFGYSVATAGSTAIVGTKGDDTAGGVNAGSSYVFTWIKGATPPTPSPTRTPTATPTATPTPSPTPTPTPTPNQSGRIVSVVSTFALPGSEVTLPVEFKSLGDEVALSFSINFDPSTLSNPRVFLGSGVPSGTTLTINPNQAAQGKIGILVDSGNRFSASPPARQIVNLTFTVAAGPTLVTFGNSPTPRSASDAAGNSLQTSFVDGFMTIQAERPHRDDFIDRLSNTASSSVLVFLTSQYPYRKPLTELVNKR